MFNLGSTYQWQLYRKIGMLPVDWVSKDIGRLTKLNYKIFLTGQSRMMVSAKERKNRLRLLNVSSLI